MGSFVHLHLHTQFSLLDGAIRFDRLFKQAKAFKMDSCAITDHGNMFGAADFFFAAKDAGIKPIVGCETYLAPKSRFDQKRIKGEDNAYHIILLAMNNDGYKNLMKLVSFAHLEGFYYVPRIDKELLREFNGNLICLTACIKGEIPSLILKGDEKRLHETVEEYRSIFGDRLYFELQDNGIEEQKIINDTLIALSKQYSVPLVATNDCHYLKKEEARAHDLLLCIQTGKTIHDEGRLSFSTDEFFFKSPEEMERAFAHCPEAIRNTMEIAQRCNVAIDAGTYHFPEFKPPGSMQLNDYLESLSREGFEKRLPGIKASYDAFTPEMARIYDERLTYELGVIKGTGFAGYFLIVADFITYAKDHGIPVGPGRGSAAGSLVAYCLAITDIDPIKYDLIFERFLNPERISMPDIDVDFCKHGREEVIRYVTEKYGKDNVAQIITFGTMQSKAAVRDVGRALGIPYAEVDKIAKLITSTDRGIEKAIHEEPQIRDLYERDGRIRELLDNAMVIEGLARHASTHAAGIVIANKHLTEHLPLASGKEKETITQYAMKTIEKIGLIKIDFLGLETLTIMNDTIKLLKEMGIELDMSTIPLDDRKTYDLLSSGDTSGVFQLESRGMRDLLVKLKPSKFDDIMPLIALYRPGPLKSGMVEEFIKRKNDPTQVKYETPQLKEILDDTYGVIIYQEQIMKIASVLAGFPIKDADALRKAMAKKIPEELERYKERFIEGAINNGVAPTAAKKIYDIILQFGEYGFNKSHSTAYGLIAYQTAYLKAHYYVPYFAAILTSEVNDTDKLVQYISELKENGVEILPPDINKSDRAFTVVDNKIRFGLAGIRNVGEAAVEHILNVRREIGEFTSFTQFCNLIGTKQANKKVIESLAKAGCFDSMALKRSQVLRMIQDRSDRPARKEGRNGQQMAMFGPIEEVKDFVQVPDMEELAHDAILQGEKEALGFYFSQHPLEPYEALISEFTAHDTQTIRDRDTTEDVSIPGIVSTCKEITTKRGDRMAYLSLEDTKGTVEVIVFPDLYGKTQAMIKGNKPLVFQGTVEKNEDGSVKIKAKNLLLLEDIAKELRQRAKVTIECDAFPLDELKRLRDLLISLRGNAKVSLEFLHNGERRLLTLPQVKVDPSRLDTLYKHFAAGIRYEVTDALLS